jgi:RNA polymerase sigma-70 factor (sigma-E family)
VDWDDDFSEYAAARGHMLIRSAVLLGLSGPDAEDLAQNTLERCYSSWEKVRSARDVDAYVYRVLVNCLVSGRRRQWTGEAPTAVLPEATTADVSDQLALGASVRAALRGMSFEHRTVLVLRYFADLTDMQVAEVLSLPLGTVKSRLSRALRQLSDDQHLADLSGNGSPSC